MAMLAEPKRRTKWTLNPRGKLWSNDDNKFGQKLLEKMGWSKGKGLGRQEQGDVDPIKLHYKNDSKGIGFKGHDDDWIAHKEDFNTILMQLNGMETPPEEEPIPVKSLEIRSKTSRARVHYHKFTRGKDLSRYSAEDLACILGKRKKSDDEAQEGDEDVEETNVEHSHGITTIKKGNIHEYFAARLAALREKPLVSQDNPDESDESKTERKVRFNDDLNMVKEFSSQTIIAPNNEQEVTGTRMDIVNKDQVIKIKKKKKKSLEKEESVNEPQEIVDKKKKKKYHNDKEENINSTEENCYSEEGMKANKKKRKKKIENVVSEVVEGGRQGMDMCDSGQEEVGSKEKKEETLNEIGEETREGNEKKGEKINFMKRKKKKPLKLDEIVMNENAKKTDLQDFNAESDKNEGTSEKRKRKWHIFSEERVSNKSCKLEEEISKRKKNTKSSTNDVIEHNRHSDSCETEDFTPNGKRKAKGKRAERINIQINDETEEESKLDGNKRKSTDKDFIQDSQIGQVWPVNCGIEDMTLKCTEANTIEKDQVRMVESQNDIEISSKMSAPSKKKKRKKIEEEVDSSHELKQKKSKKRKKAEREIKQDISSIEEKYEFNSLSSSLDKHIQKDVDNETSQCKDETVEEENVNNIKKMYNDDPSFSYLHNAIKLDKLQNVRKRYKKAEFHKFIGTNLYDINGYGNN